MPASTTDRPASLTPRPVTVVQTRVLSGAWATAPRDGELDWWRELYDLAVPRPVPDGKR